jgi:hypothetical protein
MAPSYLLIPKIDELDTNGGASEDGPLATYVRFVKQKRGFSRG